MREGSPAAAVARRCGVRGQWRKLAALAVALPLLALGALVAPPPSSPFAGSGSGGGGAAPSASNGAAGVVRGGAEFLFGPAFGFNVSESSSSAPALAPSPSPSTAPVHTAVDGDGGSSSPILSPSLPSPPPLPPPPKKRRDPSLDRIESGLAKARIAIKEAIKEAAANASASIPDKDYIPLGPVYRNAHAFHRSYLEMEKRFRIYVYEEGEPPIFHDGPCRSIYSTEGRFIHTLEAESPFRTRRPERAAVFFLPFSVVKMVKLIYEPNSHDMGPLKRTAGDYVAMLARKHRHWNRSRGADHFMLSCHDWGPAVSSSHRELHRNAIRVLCNANTSEGFEPARDASLPEINFRTDAAAAAGGESSYRSPSRRPLLAFFAGGDHGDVRAVLQRHWGGGRDPDIAVSRYLPKGSPPYGEMMRRSKFCLCPSGYEVASPRVVEAIYAGCVPVTVGEGYVLPFSDVINWKAFSVQLGVADVPRLKSVLAGVSPRQYIRMQRRLAVARRHFEMSLPPRRYDLFHMVLHSVWLRRLNVRVGAGDEPE